MARIGIVIHSLAGAGAERVSVNLAHEFVAVGHTVDFVLACGEGELMGEVPVEAGIHISHASRAKAWRSAIREYVAGKSPDVLLAMMEGAGVLSIQAANARVPIYVVSHIHFSRHCRAAPRWKERWLMPLAARWLLPKAAGVIGVSNGVTEDIRRAASLKAEKLYTIYNPILTTSFYRKAAKPVEHPWFIADREWLTVVTVGRLTKQKDQNTLLRAIHDVARERPVRLMVFGHGEKLPELQALADDLKIGDLVQFAGYETNPYRYMTASDVFALSSRWEGFGNVLVEALACGTVVVSTDCPSGPREILQDGNYGMLVPIGDSEALASAICNGKNESMKSKGLSSHLMQFKASHAAASYLRVMGIET